MTRLLILLSLLLVLGCSNPQQPRNPEAVKKEIDKVTGEIQRELQNK